MSVRIVAQVALTEASSEADATELAERLSGSARDVAEVSRAHAGVNAAGSVGGGDLTLDLLFETEDACASLLARSGPLPGGGVLGALDVGVADLGAHVASADAVVIETLDAHVGRPGTLGVKRTLLFQVNEGTPAPILANFEREMLAMPGYVPAIRNWCFGRVRTAAPCPGSSCWTHVWEQEFESVDALLGDYMLSPYHWGHLDRWYDLEHPSCIVEPRVAHVYCPATESVLSWGSPRRVEGGADRAMTPRQSPTPHS